MIINSDKVLRKLAKILYSFSKLKSSSEAGHLTTFTRFGIKELFVNQYQSAMELVTVASFAEQVSLKMISTRVSTFSMKHPEWNEYE